MKSVTKASESAMKSPAVPSLGRRYRQKTAIAMKAIKVANLQENYGLIKKARKIIILFCVSRARASRVLMD